MEKKQKHTNVLKNYEKKVESYSRTIELDDATLCAIANGMS
jgi:hypothetical protein